MTTLPRVLLFTGMILLTLVSMWTTYKSLHDSILPEPKVPIPLGTLGTWECSVIALALSVAIGIMLFALKLAIIDEQKRLNLFGIVGMTVVAFISIAFNMDVLYRTADREFFVRYSAARVKETYAKYLADVQRELVEKKKALQTALAEQEGELETEIMGLREAPAGYGPRARQEDYRLTILEKTTAVEIAALDQALAALKEADALLSASPPASLNEVEELQAKLLVAVKEPGAVAKVALPEPIKFDNPFFAVFSKLFDFRSIGFKEVFFLAIALFLDLGDIIGYSLIPNKPKKNVKRSVEGSLELSVQASDSKTSEPITVFEELSQADTARQDANAFPEPRIKRPSRKPMRFRIR